MKIVENELTQLKEEILDMWTLVGQQIKNSIDSLFAQDSQLAYSVICRERKVNATELKIDSECEDFIALYSPVAIDLRFVLAIFKINTNLERLGDFAESIARSVMNLPEEVRIDPEIMKESRLEEMAKQIIEMLILAKEALDEESTEKALQVIGKDNLVDQINKDALTVISRYLEQHPEDAYSCLQLIGIIRKLERFGDHCTNIAEEIIFYLDAKVLKHSSKVYGDSDKKLGDKA